MNGSRAPVVLVVDDEGDVRLTLSAMLAHHGYEPVPVASGDEAVAVCRVRGAEIAAAVIDVRMPGMDGPATLAALRALAPQLPCVFVSGHTGDYAEDELRALGGAFLKKPVGLDQLGDTLAAAIGRA